MVGFGKSDHPQILSCLADDIQWLLPGPLRPVGNDAFDREIEIEAFIGSPAMTITRLIEEDDVVVAEGTVRSARADGGFLKPMFCDDFVMESGKTRRLASYIPERAGPAPGKDGG